MPSVSRIKRMCNPNGISISTIDMCEFGLENSRRCEAEIMGIFAKGSGVRILLTSPEVIAVKCVTLKENYKSFITEDV